jgi:hypothetical protein
MWKARDKTVRLIILICLPAGLIFLASCGDDRASGTPAATATALPGERDHELVVYSPVGGKLIYTSFELLMKANGLPFDITIMEGATTDLTIQGMKEGVFDMVFMTRLPRPDEGIAFTELLTAAVAIYTHPDIGVDNLTTAQVAAIFAGEITNWSEVGGIDQEIVPFVLPESGSTTETLRAVALGDKPFSEMARTFPDEPSVILSATRIPGGIACATLATKNILRLADPSLTEEDFHMIAIDGMTPDQPGYPMSLVIGFGYRTDQADRVKPLLDWTTDFLISSHGQRLLQVLEVEPSVGQ